MPRKVIKMDDTKLMAQLYQSETKQEKPSPLSPEKAQLIQKGLDKLVSYGLLSDPNAVRDWANDLVDLSERELVEGFKKAKDHTGWLEFGAFRAMCKLPKSHASFRRFVPLEHLKSSHETVEYWKAKRKEEIGL